MKRVCFILLFLPLVGRIAPASVPDVVPPPGWQTAGCLSYNAGNLFRYIDGGADLFLEYGFNNLRVIRLSRGKSQLSVELYQMAEPLSALGLYLLKCTPETPVKGVVPRNSGDRYQLAMVQGPWFILIRNSDGAGNRLGVMRRVANMLAEQIPAMVTKLPCDFPEKGRVKGSIRLARGPLAARQLFNLGEGDVLRLHGKVWAVAVDYRVGNRVETWIRVKYPDGKDSRKVFWRLQKTVSGNQKLLKAGKTFLVFRNGAGVICTVNLRGRVLDIRVHSSLVASM